MTPEDLLVLGFFVFLTTTALLTGLAGHYRGKLIKANTRNDELHRMWSSKDNLCTRLLKERAEGEHDQSYFQQLYTDERRTNKVLRHDLENAQVVANNLQMELYNVKRASCMVHSCVRSCGCCPHCHYRAPCAQEPCAACQDKAGA